MKILASLSDCPGYATHRATLAVKFIEILQRKNLNHLENQQELWPDCTKSIWLLVPRTTKIPGRSMLNQREN